MNKISHQLKGKGAVEASDLIPCPSCQGKGCHMCNGAGLVKSQVMAEIRKFKNEKAALKRKWAGIDGKGV